MFPHTARANIRARLPAVLCALEAAQLHTAEFIIVALATIAVETGNFTPRKEQCSVYNTSRHGPAFDLYDRLPGNGPGDGARFLGRGYVQLTGRANYASLGPIIGRPDLVDNPDLALDPDIAASLLAAFLQSRQRPIQAALDPLNLWAIRRAVNGGSNGLQQFETAYRNGMAAWLRAGQDAA